MPAKTADPYEAYFTEAPADSTATPTPPTSPAKPQDIGKGRAQLLGGLGGAAAMSPISPYTGAAGAALGLLGGPAAEVTVPLGYWAGAAIPPVVGALLGGSGAEAWRQNINRARGLGGPEPMEAATEIGRAGLDQAMQEVYGHILMGTARAAARPLMAAALRASPKVAETAFREGITATRMGLNKLASRVQETLKAERSLVAASTRAGTRISTGEIADVAYNDVRQKFRAAPDDVLAELKQLHTQFIRKYPNGMNPIAVLRTRKYYDRVSNPQYLASAAGKASSIEAEKLWNKAVGEQARNALRRVVPTIDDPETYKRLTGRVSTPGEITKLETTLRPIVMRSPGIARRVIERGGPGAIGGTIGYTMSPENRVSGAVRGAAIGTGAGIATMPQVLSWAATRAENPILQMLLTNLPRFVQGASE